MLLMSRTGEDSLWGSSQLKPHLHSSDKRGCSIRREHRSMKVRIRALDKWWQLKPTCCWHLASLKLFFCMQSEDVSSLHSLSRGKTLTLNGTCAWMTRRVAFDILLQTLDIHVSIETHSCG